MDRCQECDGKLRWREPLTITECSTSLAELEPCAACHPVRNFFFHWTWLMFWLSLYVVIMLLMYWLGYGK